MEMYILGRITTAVMVFVLLFVLMYAYGALSPLGIFIL